MAGGKEYFDSDYDSVRFGSPYEASGSSIGRKAKRAVKSALPPLFFLLLSWYFGWNAVNGDHGLHAKADRMKDLAIAKVDLQQAIAERDDWQKRVAGLQNNHLNPDTLDERARAMLNLAEPNDIVVPYTKNDRLF